MKHFRFGPNGPPIAVTGMGPNIVELPVRRTCLATASAAHESARIVNFPGRKITHDKSIIELSFWDKLHRLLDQLETAARAKRKRRQEKALRLAIEKAKGIEISRPRPANRPFI